MAYSPIAGWIDHRGSRRGNLHRKMPDHNDLDNSRRSYQARSPGWTRPVYVMQTGPGLRGGSPALTSRVCSLQAGRREEVYGVARGAVHHEVREDLTYYAAELVAVPREPAS